MILMNNIGKFNGENMENNEIIYMVLLQGDTLKTTIEKN